MRIAILIALLLLGASLPASGAAEAHHQRATSRLSGFAITNLTHGQLEIITGYRSAILALADRLISPTLEARTLRNFADLQYTYCLWGLVPGSLRDEDSPFNECSHAYLAASKALLDVLARTAETREAPYALSRQINMALALNASALQMCRNSLGSFDTGEIVLPEWRNVTINPLAVLLGAIVLCVPGGLLVAGRNGRAVKLEAR